MGEAASLSAALLWAFAVSLFRPAIREYGARSVNLAKCTIAAVALGITAVAAGQGSLLFGSHGKAWWILVISGVIGLSIGDTALFRAVDELGPPRTLLLQSLVPLFTAAMAAVWLEEWPRTHEWLGAGIVLAGVLWVVGEGTGRDWRTVPWSGLSFATVSALCQATGIVMSKYGMQDVPILAASFLRIAAAALGLWLWLPFGGGGGHLKRLVREGAGPRVAGASLIGTYLAILLMMAGVAFTPAAVASVLLSTTPIFSLFIDARLTGRPLSWRGVAGAALAVVGVAFMTLAGGD